VGTRRWQGAATAAWGGMRAHRTLNTVGGCAAAGSHRVQWRHRHALCPRPGMALAGAASYLGDSQARRQLQSPKVRYEELSTLYLILPPGGLPVPVSQSPMILVAMHVRWVAASLYTYTENSY
jgi:hypothetical protein